MWTLADWPGIHRTPHSFCYIYATSSLSCEFHAPQTKTLEGGTKDEIRISKEALFKGVSTQIGPRSIEKCFLRNPHFAFCSSFQHLRLGGVKLRAVLKERACESRCRWACVSRRLIVIRCRYAFRFNFRTHKTMMCQSRAQDDDSNDHVSVELTR